MAPFGKPTNFSSRKGIGMDGRKTIRKKPQPSIKGRAKWRGGTSPEQSSTNTQTSEQSNTQSSSISLLIAIASLLD